MSGSGGNLIYVPKPLRIVTLIILALSLLGSIWLIYHALELDDGDDILTAAISFAQSTGAGIILVLLAFYSRHDLSFRSLSGATKTFLLNEMVFCLRALPSSPVFHTEKFQDSLTVRHVQGENMAGYEIDFGNYKLRMRLMLNVKRMVLMYYIPAENKEELPLIEAALETAISGSKNVGYETTLRFAHEEYYDRKTYAVLYCYQNNLTEEFLHDATKRYYWAQDIAQMSRSVAQCAIRSGLKY